MLRESDILLSHKNHYVTKHKDGYFEIWENGTTHATRVAVVGEKLGLERCLLTINWRTATEDEKKELRC